MSLLSYKIFPKSPHPQTDIHSLFRLRTFVLCVPGLMVTVKIFTKQSEMYGAETLLVSIQTYGHSII